MNGCVCVYGQDVLNRNPFFPMAKKLDDHDGASIPNGDETSPSPDEMFSVRSKILKTPPSKAKNSNASLCNGDLDNYIGEECSGVYFARKLDEEEQRISKLCFAVQLQMWENSPPEDVKGKIRAATGKARLLMSSKFKQFKDLCDLNAGIVTSDDGKIPTKTDLEGFWDLVMLQVVDVDSHFTKIEKLRKNGWIDSEPEVVHIKTPKSPTLKDGKIYSKKKTSQAKANASSKEDESKKRKEARKRLAEAKKAARKRLVQNPLQDDEDVIICSPPARKPES